jgi:hypothetical protein
VPPRRGRGCSSSDSLPGPRLEGRDRTAMAMSIERSRLRQPARRLPPPQTPIRSPMQVAVPVCRPRENQSMDDNTRLRSKESEKLARESGQGGRSRTRGEREDAKDASALAGQASQGGGTAAARNIVKRRNAGQDAPRVGGAKKPERIGRSTNDLESDGSGGRSPSGPSGRKGPSGTAPAGRSRQGRGAQRASTRTGKRRSGSQSNRGGKR